MLTVSGWIAPIHDYTATVMWIPCNVLLLHLYAYIIRVPISRHIYLGKLKKILPPLENNMFLGIKLPVYELQLTKAEFLRLKPLPATLLVTRCSSSLEDLEGTDGFLQLKTLIGKCFDIIIGNFSVYSDF